MLKVQQKYLIIQHIIKQKKLVAIQLHGHLKIIKVLILEVILLLGLLIPLHNLIIISLILLILEAIIGLKLAQKLGN